MKISSESTAAEICPAVGIGTFFAYQRQPGSEEEFVLYKKLRIKQIGIIWFCLGLIISFSVSAMWVSKTWNLDRFFDVGEIYDFMKTEYRDYWNPQLQEDGNYLTKDFEETTSRTLSINGIEARWRWFFVEIKSLNQPEMVWKVLFYQGTELIQEETVTLEEGNNAFPLSGKIFDKCLISIEGQQGLSFQIEKMQMYEQFPEYNSKMLLLRAGIVMAVYVVCSICYICWRIKRRKAPRRERHLYTYIEKLQYLLRYVANTLILDKTEKLSLRTRRSIRVSLLLFLMFYMNFFDMEGMYQAHFPVTVAVSALCILLIAAVSIDRRTDILDWRNPICYGWFILWSIAFLSESIVKHRYMAQAPVMIFVFGFLYFVIGNMKKPVQFMEDIVYSIEILFWFSTVFCICFRPFREGIRYQGASYSPAVFAMFQVVAMVTFLGKLESACRQKRTFGKRVVSLTEILLSLFFIWKTQSFTAIIVSVLILLVFVYRAFLERKYYRKIIGQILAMAVVLSVAVWSGMNLLLNHLPFILNTEIVFQRDVYQEQNLGDPGLTLVVQAASENRILKKIKNVTSPETMSSGRTLFWWDYIRDMNLWGHEKNAIVRAKQENPHNAIIGIGYRYGIFAFIPYIMVMFGSLYESWKNMMHRQKRGKYGKFLPFGYLFSIIVTAMADNVEIPFLWIPWLILYLSIGCVFPGRKAENE